MARILLHSKCKRFPDCNKSAGSSYDEERPDAADLERRQLESMRDLDKTHRADCPGGGFDVVEKFRGEGPAIERIRLADGAVIPKAEG